MNELIMIPIKKIEPHPDNPRKDLGDLTELAESIKQNGIMQNLTVVPWFSNTTRKPADDGKMDGYYRALIGHRRLAAAKLAGLKEVPCVIAEGLSQSEQVAIMLCENVQRADLTPIEQADGFQMMLDLGDTKSKLSERTGFSVETINSRLRLLKFERKQAEEAFSRGGSLKDFEEADKITDPQLREKVLKAMGTNNFDWELRRAKEDEEKTKNAVRVRKLLAGYAEEVEKRDYNTTHYVCSIPCSDKDFEKKLPEKEEGAEYFYCVQSWGSVEIYRGYTPEEKAAQDKKSAEAEEAKRKTEERSARNKAFEELNKRAYQSRFDWLKEHDPLAGNNLTQQQVGLYKKFAELFFEGYFAREFECTKDIDYEKLCLIFDISTEIEKAEDEDIEEFNDLDYDEQREIVENGLANKKVSPLKLALVAAVTMLDSENLNYNDYYYGHHKENSTLDYIYKFLCACGYEMSDEEKALQDGTHELFVGGGE